MITETKNKKAFFNTEIPGDWNVKHFEEVADIDRDSLNGSTPKDYEFDYISLSDVDSDDFKIETTRQVFASAPSRARRIVKQGDILMSTVRPNLQGFSLIRNEVKDLIASTGFAVITTNKCSNEFLFQFLFSSGIERQFYQLLVGSNYPAINSSDVRKLKIPLPPLPEQKAIAQMLSTADAAIHTTDKLIAQKELRKKWLMQQLLTGKKRLKGFDGEWKETAIGEMGIIQTGNTPSKLDPKNWDGKHNWCTADDMKSKYVSNTLQKLSDKGWETARIAKANSVLVTCIASIGVNAIAKVDTGFNQQINSITPSTNYNVEFIYYLILFSKNKLMEYAGAGALPMLNKNTFMSIKFKIPILEEQTAIAQVLQAADKEISLLKAKAEKLREQKKGLMQQLLTGKVRLKINNT